MSTRYSPLPAALAALLVGLFLSIAAVAPMHAQGAAGREQTIYVSAVDNKGEPVEGLGPADFVVREDNARREVLRVSRAVEPIDVAILVDNSIAAEKDISNIRDALRPFVSEMRGGNAITIVGLGDRPTILTDYTSDEQRLRDAIGRIHAQPGSGMLLLDAIVEVSRGLLKRDTPRAVIVPVITEGTEFSTLHHQQVTDHLKRAGAALHAVTIGAFAANLDDPARNRAIVLDSGTRQSGGQRITVLSSLGLAQTLQRLARQLKAQYKVVYGRPQSLIPPEKLEVEGATRGITMRAAPQRPVKGA